MKYNQIDSRFEKTLSAILTHSEKKEYLELLENEPVTAMKRNTAKADNIFDNVEAMEIPWCKEGLLLKERPAFTFDPIFHAGHYYVQDPSAMFLDFLLENLLPELGANPIIADLCAAPGGKSVGILNRLEGRGLLLANEITPKRKQGLVENLSKWGHPNVMISGLPLETMSKAGPLFDLIVIDAPCSGEGMFRKSEAARLAWSPDTVEMNARRQEKILVEALKLVKPGGYVIYCTCTLNQRENEEVIETSPQRNCFEPIFINLPKKWNVLETTSSGLQFFRFLHHRVKGEGMTYTCFRVTGNNHQSIDLSRVYRFTRPGKEEREAIRPFLKEEFLLQNTVLQLLDEVYILKNTIFHEAQMMLAKINCRPLSIGSLKKNFYAPAHFTAMSTASLTYLPKIEVDHSSALDYLRKKSFTIEGLPRDGGYALLAYQNAVLGLIKIHIGGQKWTNLYPTGFRIVN
ncbi:MAG: hypothetical protein EA409_08470 [Saprospirales bacterium]|nr:MAG: hypothetical protein EA409_08470 [Saprospirales bacterium]